MGGLSHMETYRTTTVSPTAACHKHLQRRVKKVAKLVNIRSITINSIIVQIRFRPHLIWAIFTHHVHPFTLQVIPSTHKLNFRMQHQNVPSLHSWWDRIPVSLVSWLFPLRFLFPALSTGLFPDSSRRYGGSHHSPLSCGCRYSSEWWPAWHQWACHCTDPDGSEPLRSGRGKTRCRRAECLNPSDSERGEETKKGWDCHKTSK